jgi:molybdopterin/thiamine biosynthesis adenylyltransferase
MTLLIEGKLDEIALYDRQIRLWGVKAQEKYDSSHDLLFDHKGEGVRTDLVTFPQGYGPQKYF